MYKGCKNESLRGAGVNLLTPSYFPANASKLTIIGYHSAAADKVPSRGDLAGLGFEEAFLRDGVVNPSLRLPLAIEGVENHLSNFTLGSQPHSSYQLCP